jgi:uncharacterized membrane protein
MTRRDWLLGFAAAAPPLAWAAMLLLGSYEAEFAFSNGTRHRGHVWGLTSSQFVLITVVVAAVIVIIAGVLAYVRWRGTRGAVKSNDDITDVRRERREFTAVAAMLSSFVFLLIVILSGLPLIWFSR